MKKIKLLNIAVDSFVTSLDNKESITIHGEVNGSASHQTGCQRACSYWACLPNFPKRPDIKVETPIFNFTIPPYCTAMPVYCSNPNYGCR